MTRILKISTLALCAVLISFLPSTSSAQEYDDYDDYDDRRGDVSYQTFYDELSPHGSWIDFPEYGYVWRPRLGSEFRPYHTRGHWVWSDDYDWIWVSDYDWGWAPFHYGRWFHDPHYGWLWVPGYEWSPAWVAWRHGGDYYGWAPIRPGIHISINFSLGGYYAPDIYWNFTPRRYITSRNIYNHCIDYRRNTTIINHTTIINNYNYGRNGWRTGPSRFDAERYAGRIQPVRFRESNRPGRAQIRGNEVGIYRPRVQSDNSRFTPRKFERADRTNAGNTDRGRDVRINENRSNGRNNNTPGTNDNSRFERRNQPQRGRDVRINGNRPNERNNNLPQRENNGRIERRNSPSAQPQEDVNRSGNDRRRIERRVEDNNGSRAREPRVFQPQSRNENTSRRIERNQNNNRPSNDQRAIRPTERGNQNNNNNEFRRIERNGSPSGGQRREVNTERRQEQPRQLERRENSNRGQSNDGGNNNNGKRKRS